MVENTIYNLLLHHGTNNVISKTIMQDGFKIKKSRDDHWLGDGVYFFREDAESALLWSKMKFKEDDKTESYHVLEIQVNVNGENFLNLDSREGMLRLKKFTDELRNKVLGFKFNTDDKKTRHFIMSLLPASIKVIQYTFKVNSGFFSTDPLRMMKLGLNSKQVCIRDEKVMNDVEVNIAKVESCQRALV